VLRISRATEERAEFDIGHVTPPDGAFAWFLTEAKPIVGLRARDQISPLGLR
jgi:hypothetical protein